jgi:riboflavin kinase/FMN adenylyltransferase
LGEWFVTASRRSALTPAPVDRIPEALKGGVVAVGNFDGVHRGHQALLAHARADADRLGVPAVALTFEPHPRTFFRPETPVFRLTTVEAKARLLAALGMDGLVLATFDRAFAGIPAEDFVTTILRDRLALRAAVVGHDFHFGKGRLGTPDVLRQSGERLGFSVEIVRPIGDMAGVFASTDIRQALAEGDIARANRLLGYRWFVAGTVMTGDRRGRDLGFPTANLRMAPDCGLAHGIYAVRVRTPDGVERDGVASYGRRPTFDNGHPLLEAHVFDFQGDLYGSTIVVGFLAWLRPEKKFASVDALIAAMHDDSAAARAVQAAAGAGTNLDRALAAVGI